MEITLEKALRNAVEAHKSGNIQEADRYYTSILKVDPTHSDANHNMGVLAVGVGKVDAALKYFETAISSNPNITQYWLSYIDALIKLGRLDEAKVALGQLKVLAKKNEEFRQLAERLEALSSRSNNRAPTAHELQPKTGDNLKDAQSSIHSEYKDKKGCRKSPEIVDPPRDWLAPVINEYKLGQYQKARESTAKLLKQFPKSLKLYNILAETNHTLGNLEHAIKAYANAILLKPDYPEAYNNMGNAFQDLGKTDAAIASYQKAIQMKPNYAEAYYNMGNVFKDKCNKEEALSAYQQAVSMKIDYSEAYNNMGTVLNDLGRHGKALKAFKSAISIKSNFAEAYNNMGVAYYEQGRLEEASEAYKNAISIKSNYAEAYNNMGATLSDLGRILEAKSAYKGAISIEPDFDEPYWGLYGTSEELSEAKKWIKQCLKANPNHLKAKLTLSALEFYNGNRSEFEGLLKSPLKDNRHMRSFAWVFSLPKLPPLHFHRWALFDHMISLSKRDRAFYEFGVWRGESFRYLIKTFKKGYGFDSFDGLPEDWYNEAAGTYSSDGNIPKINGGEFIVGKFEDTLASFFSDDRPTASIINFDADLYSSTICALNFAKPVIDKHTILIFDEFIINENWEQDEYKALEEFCVNNNYTYEVLAISFFTKQVAVKIIGV